MTLFAPHHGRFMVAFALGGVAAGVIWMQGASTVDWPLAGVNVFFLL